jgi:hypothetical protein
MERLELGYAAVKKINPRIVYCSISGYGQQGPRASEAGHDINYQSLTGLLALQPGPIEKPVVPPALTADIGGGTMPAVINILLGLRQRDMTGEGVYLDIAMTTRCSPSRGTPLRSGTRPGSFRAEVRLVGGSPRFNSIRRATASSSPAGAGAEILARVLQRLGCRRHGERPGRSGSHQGAIAQIINGEIAAHWRNSPRMLRHHYGDAAAGAARPTFRRTRSVRAPSRGTDRRDHAGAAGADRREFA